MSIANWILFSFCGLWDLAVSCTMTWKRPKEDDDSMWTIYVNILLVGCLPAMHKSRLPYPVNKPEEGPLAPAKQPYVPQELVEIIITHLDGDSRSLQNCSLVCKSWVHPSRIHLFRNIVLNFYDLPRSESGRRHYALRSISRKSSALLKCLDSSPVLSWYILSLEIRNCWCVNSTSRDLKETLRTLARLLPKLRHVTKFVIRNSHWESLSDKDIRRSLSTLLSLPALKHIYLDTLTVVTYEDLGNILSLSPNLRTLVLNDITCIKSQAVGNKYGQCHWQRAMPAQSIELRELQIDSPGLSPHLDWLCYSQSPFNVGNIQRLRLSARSLSRNTASHLLQDNYRTLQRLELGATLTNDLGLHMNLSMMANIQTLTLRLVTIDAVSATAFFHPLDASQAYALEEVIIELLSPALIWKDWSELDASLVQPQLPRLRRVQIQVPAGIWRWTNPNFEKFKAQFPATEGRGILRIRTD